MEGKGSFVILLVIVAFLSLTLAVLAGYVFFVAGNSKPSTELSQKESTKRLDDKLFASEALFEGKKLFNLKNEDEKKIAYIQVNVELKYFIKVKGIKDVKLKLSAYNGEIKELVGAYFQNLTMEDVKEIETRKKAKEDLKKEINDLLNSSEKEKKEFIYEVIIAEWLYQ